MSPSLMQLHSRKRAWHRKAKVQVPALFYLYVPLHFLGPSFLIVNEAWPGLPLPAQGNGCMRSEIVIGNGNVAPGQTVQHSRLEKHPLSGMQHSSSVESLPASQSTQSAFCSIIVSSTDLSYRKYSWRNTNTLFL